MMKLKLKLLSPEAFIPRKAHPGDAAFDVFIPRDITIHPGRQKIPLDIALEIPPFHQAQIEPRSGFSLRGIEAHIKEAASKINIDADVIVGKIDSNYRGNIAVIVNCHEKGKYTLQRGLRIAQLTIYSLPHFSDFEITEHLQMSDRGANGFGSSGSK